MHSLLSIVKNSWKFLAILALVGGLFGAYPYIGAQIVAGSEWQGVVPKFTDDSLYYVTRANSVVHEGVMVNPYYAKEYSTPSPSITLVDYILGVTHLFLDPFTATVVNTFLWSSVFALLFGTLMLWLGFSRKIIIIAWLIVVGSIFWHMIRTGHTQIMYPYFVAFFLVLLFSWKSQKDSPSNLMQGIFLGTCAGLTAYLYTFLFQIIFASLFFAALLSLVLRRKEAVRLFVVALVAMIVISIPYLLYFKGVTDLPYFAETMNRYLGVRSHMLSAMVYFLGRGLILLLVWSYLLWVAHDSEVRQKTGVADKVHLEPSLEAVILTIAAISLGTLGVMSGNVVTGVDVQAISHAYYFVHILLPFGLIFYARATYRVLKKSGAYAQKLIILFCSIMIIYEVAIAIPPQFPKRYLYDTENLGPQPTRLVGNPQYIMPALQAIKDLPNERVLLAPEPINGYIPLYTGKHVLFNFYAGMYLVGTTESVERSFASHLGKPLTKEEVTTAYYDSELLNTEVQQRNRVARKFCSKIFNASRCAELIVAGPFSSDVVINDAVWFDYYQVAVRPNFLSYLHHYNVTDIVVDVRLPLPQLLEDSTPWYQDKHFAIYNLPLLAKY